MSWVFFAGRGFFSRVAGIVRGSRVSSRVLFPGCIAHDINYLFFSGGGEDYKAANSQLKIIWTIVFRERKIITKFSNRSRKRIITSSALLFKDLRSKILYVKIQDSRTLFNHGKNSSGYILQTIAQTKLQIQKNIYIYVTLENLLSMSAVGTKVYVI